MDGLSQGVIYAGLGTLLIFVALIVFAPDHSGPTYEVSPVTNVDSGYYHAEQICKDRGGAQAYDIQDQNRMVYACKDDHILHVFDYSNMTSPSRGTR